MNAQRDRHARIWIAVEAFEKARHPKSAEWKSVKEAMWLEGRDQTAVRLIAAEQAVIKAALAIDPEEVFGTASRENLKDALKDLKTQRTMLALFQDVPMD